jgi:hypothetical protein
MCPKARGSVLDVHFIELDPPAECISIDDQSQDNIRGGSGQERARYLGPTAVQHARGAAILPQAPHRVSRRSPLGRQQHVTILSPTRSIWSPVSSPRISVAFRRRLVATSSPAMVLARALLSALHHRHLGCTPTASLREPSGWLYVLLVLELLELGPACPRDFNALLKPCCRCTVQSNIPGLYCTLLARTSQ